MNADFGPLVWNLFKALLLGLAAGCVIVFLNDLVRRRRDQRRFGLRHLWAFTTLVAMLLAIVYWIIHLT